MGMLDLALRTPLSHAPQEILGWTVRRNRMHAVRPIAGGRQTDPTTAPDPAGAPTGQPAPVVTVPAPPPPSAPSQQTQTFDPAAERERIRQEIAADFERQRREQEEAWNARLAPFEQERAEQQRIAQEAENQRLEAERRAREAEETAAQTAQRIAEENRAQLAAMQEELGRRDAILAQEQRLNHLASYTRQRVEEAGDRIMPHLRANVYGNSEAEIDAALSRQIQITDEIVGDIQARNAGQVQLQQQVAQLAPGVTPTAPAMGPLEGNGAGQPVQFTNQQLQEMSPSEYAQHRQALLNWTSQARRQQ